MKIFFNNIYSKYFSDKKFFSKLSKLPGKILSLMLIQTFLLYELLKEQQTPVFIKTAIIATLGYLICPIDAIPDFMPGGYVDDIAMMTALLAAIDHLISDEIKRKAEARANRFTGGDPSDAKETD